MSEVKTNKISSLASNNDITLDPDGTGDTIITSGKLGIGTSSPPDNLSVVTSGSNAQLSVDRSDGGAGRTVLIHSSTGGQLQTTGSVPLLFGTADTERMRVDASGNVLAGTTTSNYSATNGFGVIAPTAATYAFVSHPNGTSNSTDYIAFSYNGSRIGNITQASTSSVAYNTSSDYRMKENITYTWDATTRLKQLKPARFNFIVDADTTVDGFLAHEAQAVVPESVTGTKDAVDDDGNPVMQGIDQSKLVPLLCKTILELEARITALEAE